MTDLRSLCSVCGIMPSEDCVLRDEIQPTLCPRRAGDPQIPSFTLDATNPHGARSLRDLARLTRPTDPGRALELEALAVRFDAWRVRSRAR